MSTAFRNEYLWRRRLKALNGSIAYFSAGNPTNLLKSILKNDGCEKVKKNAWIVFDSSEMKEAVRAYLAWLEHFANGKKDSKKSQQQPHGQMAASNLGRKRV